MILEGILMEKELKEIELVFESVNFCRIPTEYIESINLSGIKESQDDSDSFVEEVHLVIKKEANGKTFTGDSENKVYFEDIKEYNDITSIELHYDNGTNKVMYVDYDGDEENELQRTKYDKDKNLVIEIGEFVRKKHYKRRR